MGNVACIAGEKSQSLGQKENSSAIMINSFQLCRK